MGRTFKRRDRKSWAAHSRRCTRDIQARIRRCRSCGCTDENACVTDAGACHWVAPDFCSACELAQQMSPPIATPIDPRDLARLDDDDGGSHA